MKKGTYTSQYFTDREEYLRVREAIRRKVEELGGRGLSLSPQVDGLMAVQGVLEAPDDGYIEDNLSEALSGIKTENSIFFMLIGPGGEDYVCLEKLCGGQVMAMEAYHELERL